MTKCWDGKAENRPTAKELCQKLKKLDDEIKNHEDEDNEDNDNNERSGIRSQIKECEIFRKEKIKSKNNLDPEAYISKSLSDCLSCKI
ncbi:unnamed protein product [Rhizophagus irregularis]|nr:unnamed protein product [Rhizophagus irregularis]